MNSTAGRHAKAKWRRFALSASVSAAVALLSALGLFSSIDRNWRDYLSRRFAAAPDSRVAVVAIDDEALARYGRWPWPRIRTAALVEAVSKAKPACIGLDLILSEPDAAGDEAMARAAAGSRVILPVYTIGKRLGRGASWFEAAPGFIHPVKVLEKSAAGVGHVLVVPDNDGVVRRVPQFVAAEGGFVPAFALEVARTGAGLSAGHIRFVPGERLSVQDHSYRLDSSSSLAISYTRPFVDTVVSASDLLETGQTRKDAMNRLRGKWVLIGATAMGVGDRYPTPLSVKGDPVPGVLIQAAALQSLVSGKATGETGPIAMLVWTLALGLLVSALQAFLSRPAWLADSVALAGVVGVIVWSAMAFSSSQTVVAPGGPVMVAVVLAGTDLAIRAARSERRREALARYTGIAEPEEFHPGEERTMAVMFADLRGWSAVSAELGPGTAAALVKPYLSAMAGCVTHYGGRVDKFPGDAVMAVFPVGEAGDARRVVLAAQAVRRAVESLPDSATMFPMQAGIGIAFGPVAVTDLGGETRADYTVVGHTVNLARALEDLAGPGQILACFNGLPGLDPAGTAREWGLRSAGRRLIKGTPSGIDVYEAV